MPSPCRPDALSAISIPTRYSACHLHTSKVQCMLSTCQKETPAAYATLPAIPQAYRIPFIPYPCQQETLQAIFVPDTLHAVSMPTRYPECFLNANKCIYFNSLFCSITREMSHYFSELSSKVTRNCALNKIFLYFTSTRIKQKATCVNALLLVRRSFQL